MFHYTDSTVSAAQGQMLIEALLVFIKKKKKKKKTGSNLDTLQQVNR